MTTLLSGLSSGTRTTASAHSAHANSSLPAGVERQAAGHRTGLLPGTPLTSIFRCVVQQPLVEVPHVDQVELAPAGGTPACRPDSNASP